MVSAALLVMLFPLVLLVALIVFIDLGRPILFVQTRPGRYGRSFRMYKFRTMRTSDDGSDADRLTKVGRFLRAWSLDELPELWNVIAGDMSLVGPRPLLMEYLPLYSASQARRHEVRPGLTGWAQINGRNSLCWPERFRLDVWYVDNQSFWLDLKVLWRTLVLVVKREGISHPGDATMPKFAGNDQ